MMMDQHANMGRRCCLLAAIVTLAFGLVTAAAAEVHVEGDLSALRVTASGDTLSDVLSTFGSLFQVKYRTAVPLDVEMNGAYSGSFSQVVSRLLNGYNYVIKKDENLIEIIIVGKRGEVAVPPEVPTTKGALSRWR
jgi:hypothetical protein